MKWSLTIVGVVLVVFALVWLLAIFPLLDKIPEKHDREVNFEGTYYVTMDPAAPPVEIPVCVQRVQKATEVKDNVVIIDETVTCFNALDPQETPLEQFGQFGQLSVDRSTREYVSDQADGMPRSGQFCFPSDVEKESYPIWNVSAMRPLTAEFVEEEELHGLKVFVFKISEQGLDIGTDPVSGYPQVMYTEITMKVEPITGTTVYTESYLARSIVQAPEPYYISNIAFTDDTRDELVDEASGNRSLFLWATVYGFWIAIGMGAALIVTGVVMFVRATR